MAASKRVVLDLAAFLDHLDAAPLPEVPREHARTLVETFLTACYEDLGKAPHLIDGEETRAVLETFLPARLSPGDESAPHLPAVLERFLVHLEEARVVPNAFEVRRALDEGLDALVVRIRSGENAREQLATRQEPVRHRVQKLGRNDPCSCGSGKKFKKCHGKGT